MSDKSLPHAILSIFREVLATVRNYVIQKKEKLEKKETNSTKNCFLA